MGILGGKREKVFSLLCRNVWLRRNRSPPMSATLNHEAQLAWATIDTERHQYHYIRYRYNNKYPGGHLGHFDHIVHKYGWQKMDWIRKQLGMTKVQFHQELGISRMYLFRCLRDGPPRLVEMAVLGLWYSRKMSDLLEKPAPLPEADTSDKGGEEEVKKTIE